MKRKKQLTLLIFAFDMKFERTLIVLPCRLRNFGREVRRRCFYWITVVFLFMLCSVVMVVKPGLDQCVLNFGARSVCNGEKSSTYFHPRTPCPGSVEPSALSYCVCPTPVDVARNDRKRNEKNIPRNPDTDSSCQTLTHTRSH